MQQQVGAMQILCLKEVKEDKNETVWESRDDKRIRQMGNAPSLRDFGEGARPAVPAVSALVAWPA